MTGDDMAGQDQPADSNWRESRFFQRRPSADTLAWVAASMGAASRIVGHRRLTGGVNSAVHRLTAALSAGASGFLLKDIRAGQLTEAVRTVAAGEAMLSPTVTRRLIEEHLRLPPPDSARHRLAPLTPREVEVLELVAQGLNNAEIAQLLFLTTATVKTHVGRILAKLGLRDRVQAVILAYETGLVRAG